MKAGYEIPVNATAGRVIARGEHHSYKPDECHLISDVPLPIAHVPGGNPEFKDLTGTVFGRLTVVGFSATHNRRWVCRCACGNYVLRTSKAVKKGAGAMCEHCSMFQQAKRNEYHKRTGKFVDLEDFKG